MADYSLFLLIFIVMLSSLSLTALVRHHAATIGLIHLPNHRSSHQKITPHGGGLAIALITITGGLGLAWYDTSYRLLYLWTSSLFFTIAILGLWDDIKQLSARFRLFIQALLCTVLLLSLPLFLQTHAPSQPLEHFASPNFVDHLLMGAGLLLLLFASLWWINLFNFMDGIDGLAGSQTIFMLFAALSLIVLRTDIVLQQPLFGSLLYWMLIVFAATVGFVILNWSPARIFMGDVGSISLAFILLFFAFVTTYLHIMDYIAWLILAAIFISDATITLARRIWQKQAWWQGHRSHAYQRLARRWQSHKKVTLLSIAINLCWLLPLAFASQYDPLRAWLYLLAAYIPLSMAIWRIGAGLPDLPDNHRA
ncbi:MAG TPA: glycosyl transferase family 4 [Thiothrix sp.]|nr:glycosyl transferase family 4 [Thiothrix sp.]